MKDQISDGVREAGNAAFGELGGKIFDAADWIDVGAFAAEEFDQGLRRGHTPRAYTPNWRR